MIHRRISPFDVDGLEPRVMHPVQGLQKLAAFTTLEAQLMIRGLSGLNIVGGDVVEVAPPFDPSGYTALAGASILFEILCVASESLSQKQNNNT